MRKKVAVLLVTVSVILMMFTLPASAAGVSLDYRAYYCWSTDFYCFAGLPGAAEDVTASVHDGREFGNDVSPVSLADSGAKINYCLLVDLSPSMKSNSGAIADFAGELVSSGNNISVSILGCGASVSVRGEDLTSESAIENAISELDFSSENSDVALGVTDALGYLSHKRVSAGNITELVLFTGGGALFAAPDINAADTATASGDTADAIKATPEIIVHSYCFGKWNENIRNAVSKGTGLVSDSQGQHDLREFAGALKEYNASTYLMKFRMYNFPDNGNRFDTYIRTRILNESGQVSLNNIARLDKIKLEDWKLPVREEIVGSDISDTNEAIPEETTALPDAAVPEETTEISWQNTTTEPTGGVEGGSTEESSAVQTADTDGTASEPGESASQPGDTTAPASQTEISVISVPTVTDVSTEPAAPAENNGGGSLTTILIIVGAAVAFIAGVVIIAVVIARSTSRKKRAAVPPYASVPAAMPMPAPVPAPGAEMITAAAPVQTMATAAAFNVKIRFVSSGFADTVINAAEPCIIGSNSACALQLHHATVTLRNAQISLRGRDVYIEDLNQVSNTAVNGERITGPTLLSGGDEICVGNVRFRVYFQ